MRAVTGTVNTFQPRHAYLPHAECQVPPRSGEPAFCRLALTNGTNAAIRQQGKREDMRCYGFLRPKPAECRRSDGIDTGRSLQGGHEIIDVGAAPA